MGGRVVLFLRTLNLSSKNHNFFIYIFILLFYVPFLVIVFFFFFFFFLVDNFCFLFFNKQPLSGFLKYRCFCISQIYKYNARSFKNAYGKGLFIVKLQAYSLLLDWKMRSFGGVFKHLTWILKAFFFLLFFKEQL